MARRGRALAFCFNWGFDMVIHVVIVVIIGSS